MIITAAYSAYRNAWMLPNHITPWEKLLDDRSLIHRPVSERNMSRLCEQLAGANIPLLLWTSVPPLSMLEPVDWQKYTMAKAMPADRTEFQ